MKLAVSGVSKHFQGVTAVNDVTLECASGEIVGLIGPNGAGKTTLLNMISSLLTVDAGTITLGDQAVHNIGPRQIARSGVARTFQNIRLCPNLTVRQNIEVAYTTARRHRRQRLGQLTIERLMHQLGIAHFAEHKASELAYGTQRRVEIARALALAPEFLLLDEPTAGMIESETKELIAAIMEIRDWMGCGVVVIDHDLSFITTVCERIYVLDMGRLVASGPPSVLRDDPRVAEIYLGRKARRQAIQAVNGPPSPA
ncbi:ABC transporter ATP-binding protein [Aquamicrobium ahrensii]|uniref:Branched-chain amino acid transport system ATP-binding protein n=1 Tax=Aquamicrobium ahrensii TaxID=469551 RepID=A0ABV2KKW8_9HYPH